MNAEPKVVICVEGGVITACTSNIPNLKVVVVDYDVIDEKANREQAEEGARKGTEDCIHDVF